jgi:hypothetical protein
MTRRRSFRSQLYRGARDLGNLEAVEHGGATGYGRRIARRKVYSKSMGVTRRLTRDMGLK